MSNLLHQMHYGILVLFGAASVCGAVPNSVAQIAWDVSFDPELGGPEDVRFETLVDWTTRPEPGIKYYSGIATYRTAFDAPEVFRGTATPKLLLDLGQVQNLAKVRLNGHDLGVVWWLVSSARCQPPWAGILHPPHRRGSAVLPGPFRRPAAGGVQLRLFWPSRRAAADSASRGIRDVHPHAATTR
jgi:hypothetical protein